MLSKIWGLITFRPKEKPKAKRRHTYKKPLMNKGVLTEEIIKSIVPDESKPYTKFTDSYYGLYLRVSRNGRKALEGNLIYKKARRWISYGEWPETSLEEARARQLAGFKKLMREVDGDEVGDKLLIQNKGKKTRRASTRPVIKLEKTIMVDGKTYHNVIEVYKYLGVPNAPAFYKLYYPYAADIRTKGLPEQRVKVRKWFYYSDDCVNELFARKNQQAAVKQASPRPLKFNSLAELNNHYNPPYAERVYPARGTSATNKTINSNGVEYQRTDIAAKVLGVDYYSFSYLLKQYHLETGEYVRRLKFGKAYYYHPEDIKHLPKYLSRSTLKYDYNRGIVR